MLDTERKLILFWQFKNMKIV